MGRAVDPARPETTAPFVLIAMSTTFMDHLDQLQRGHGAGELTSAAW